MKAPTKTFFIPNGNSVHLGIPLKDRVKVLLNRKGMSQNKLADEVGVSIGTMSKIVNGDWIPTSQVMTRMGQILECDSVVLFGDTEYWKVWRAKMLYPEEERESE
jgi:transcriptional regulator with XRE-family HTH domain